MPQPISSTPQTPPPAPGMVLDGRFRLEESLGSGGMAEVFRATEVTSGRRVAVKVLRTGPDQSVEATARLRREGQVLRALKNPAIVGIEDVIELEGGRVVLVMELLLGETLGARMRRGKIEPGELATIVAGVAAGLSAAHANGVVHRDLKPDNIFLGKHADGRVQVKLLDFGVSKIWGGEKLTQTGQVLGTPRYMSPEQLGAEPEVDHRVDVYSLGVILYEALTGKPPFLAHTPTDLIVAILHGKVVPLRSLRPDLPSSIEGVVMRAMARVRDARFRAATELADSFFEASGIDASARALPRAGMATTPLGSMKTGEPGAIDVDAAAALHAANVAAASASAAQASPPRAAPPPSASAEPRQNWGSTTPSPSADPLAPGTFSELPAFDEARIRAEVGALPTQMSAPHAAQSRAAAAAALAPEPARVPAPNESSRRAIPQTAVSMLEVPAPVAAMPPAAHASSRMSPGTTSPLSPARRDPSSASPHASVRRDPSEPVASASIAGARSVAPRVIEPPSPARGRLVLAVVGLAAGAISAGVAIALLTWLSAGRSAETAPPPPPPPGVTEAAEETETTTGEPTTEEATTEAAEATAPTTTVTPPEPSPSTTTTPRPRRPARETPTAEPDETEHTDSTPIDPLRDPLGAAQRILTGGGPTSEADRCQQLIDRVLGTGDTPIALRRRADCLMRAGRTDEAIADYQRFCRLAPDSPAIGEVREILEGRGRTCP